MNAVKTRQPTEMTSVQKTNAREMGYQLERDFKFHLQEDIDLSHLRRFIESGNSLSVDEELAKLTLLYAEKIKAKASSNYC